MTSQISLIRNKTLAWAAVFALVLSTIPYSSADHDDDETYEWFEDWDYELVDRDGDDDPDLIVVEFDPNTNSTEEIEINTISEFGLTDAYPNPFNPSTTFTLAVPSADYVSVKVYNLMGQVVGTLAEGMMEASVYTFTWNASDMSSGVYLIKAESSSSIDVQKVLLVK